MLSYASIRGGTLHPSSNTPLLIRPANGPWLNFSIGPLFGRDTGNYQGLDDASGVARKPTQLECDMGPDSDGYWIAVSQCEWAADCPTVEAAKRSPKDQPPMNRIAADRKAKEDYLDGQELDIH